MKYSYEDIDRRINKTNLVLSSTILTLIKNNQKNKVSDICKQANVSRLTYYRHFNNREDLLQYAIERQLEGVLPIPRKLKPINLKHLLYYLINSLGLFIRNNKELLCSSLQQIKGNGLDGSYLFLVIKTFIELIRKEIELLLGHNNLSVNLINNIICGSVLNVFFQMLINGAFINTTIVWNTFKSVNVLLN